MTIGEIYLLLITLTAERDQLRGTVAGLRAERDRANAVNLRLREALTELMNLMDIDPDSWSDGDDGNVQIRVGGLVEIQALRRILQDVG
jgi:hypothetical protein